MAETLRERVARAIAEELGDDFNQALECKAHWIEQRGGSPFRDINMPFKPDYLDAADRAISEVVAEVKRLAAA